MIVALVNPENRRATFFEQAVQEVLGRPTHVLSWEDYLNGAPIPDPIELFRIDSPGENSEVERLLIQRGAEVLGQSSPDYDPAHGRIQHNRLWFAGFKDALTNLPDLPFLNDPEAILVMTDKVQTHAWFDELGVSHPPFHGLVHDFSDVQNLIHNKHFRLFLKPRFGSSASGVIALRSDGKRFHASTSVEVSDGQLFNSLKVRTYDSEREVAHLIDVLGQEELIAETWVPKAGIGRDTCDLRLVATRSSAAVHAVVRLSKSPMTNLHLGNRRGHLNDVLSRIGEAQWADLMSELQRILSSKKGAFYSGFDVTFDSSWRRSFVLEANAFGDLIPGVLVDGMDTYSAQLQSWLSLQNPTSEF